MTLSTASIPDFLAEVPPFDRLSSASREYFARKLHPLRYRMGQAIVVRESLPAQVSILYEGQARLLGYSLETPLPETLKRLEPGALLGVSSLIRGVPCETVIASTESVCLTLSVHDFRSLLQQEPEFATAFQAQCFFSELYDLLGQEAQCSAIGHLDLNALTERLLPESKTLTLLKGKHSLGQLDPTLRWFLSGGSTNYTVGSPSRHPV